MQNVSPWQLLHELVSRSIFPGTIGILLRTFLVTGSPFCSRTQVKLRQPTMRWPFANSTAPRPYDWEKVAPAGFRRTENGRSEFSLVVQGESLSIRSAPANLAPYLCPDWNAYTAVPLISWQMEKESPSTVTSPVTEYAAISSI